MTGTRRRISASLVASLALIAMGSTVAAGDGQGPTTVVAAADDASVRVGVRFPSGWRLEAGADSDARRQIDLLSADERCELSTRTSAFDDPTTDIDDFVVSLGPGSGFTLLDREAIVLPAGPAERIDIAADEGGRWSVYMVPDGRHMHELWCRADELPDDRWQTIAETIETGPDMALVGSPFDGEVELAEQGLALTFPEAWQVRGSSVQLGLLYATSDTAVCSVSDYSSLAPEAGWQTVQDMHDSFVANAAKREDLSVDDVSYLDLPAGVVGLADVSFADGTRAIRYSFAHAQTWLGLFCVSEQVPADRWMSLAESWVWTPEVQAPMASSSTDGPTRNALYWPSPRSRE